MRWWTPMVAMALAACSGSGKPDPNLDPTIFPKDYKSDIIQSVPLVNPDIDGFKDTGITDPVFGAVGTGQVYYVCIRGNPHEAGTGYLGDKTLIAYFLGGKINQLVTTSDERCAKAAYKPFPELDKYCRGATCSRRR